MNSLYFDGQAGASGDMILGALIDLGVDPGEIESALRPIVPGDFSIEPSRVSDCGISAIRAQVRVTEDVRHRHLPQVLGLIDKGNLSPEVRRRAGSVFRRLAEAEARVHSSTVDKVHFHEVGANDAIIDIVGAIWGIDRLGVDRVYAAPLTLGSGLGVSAHGPITYPAPAVLEILKGLPARFADGIGETTTPTGAAILAEVAEFSDNLMIVPEKIGYGAGSKSFADRPNLLRATIGPCADVLEHDTLSLGTSDIDNTLPEVFDHVCDKLRAAGAIDVVTLDVGMKKNRRGIRLEVLCESARRHVMSAIILRETGSLGVRWQTVGRDKLPRRVETVDTPWGPIRVKLAVLPDTVRAIPEHDDCRAVASKLDVPLIEVIDRVTALYYDQDRRSASRGE